MDRLAAHYGASEGAVTISLVHVGERAWTPTDGRWASFGWRVVPDSHRITDY